MVRVRVGVTCAAAFSCARRSAAALAAASALVRVGVTATVT